MPPWLVATCTRGSTSSTTVDLALSCFTVVEGGHVHGCGWARRRALDELVFGLICFYVISLNYGGRQLSSFVGPD